MTLEEYITIVFISCIYPCWKANINKLVINMKLTCSTIKIPGHAGEDWLDDNPLAVVREQHNSTWRSGPSVGDTTCGTAPVNNEINVLIKDP